MLDSDKKLRIEMNDWPEHFQKCKGLVLVDSLPEDEDMGGVE